MFESTSLMYKGKYINYLKEITNIHKHSLIVLITEAEDLAYENAVAAIGTGNNSRNLHLLNNNNSDNHILSH